jgi:hypothetical protein
MQALPDASRAFGHIGLRLPEMMHFEILVRAIGEERGAPRAEICKAGDVLLGGQSRCLMELDGGHCRLLIIW